MSDQFPKKITDIITIPFSVDKFGLYSVTITAHCQSSKQDLRVEIDSLKFRELPPKDKPQYNNIPSSWNGTELKELSKTIIFILRLNKGAHKLIFIPTEEAIINEYKIESISDPQGMQFNLDIQAEDGDRRPWLVFALIDLPLKDITVDVSTKWHFLDGDDVKLIIDNQIQKNLNSILHKNWIWSASVFNIFSKERQEKTFTENLQNNVHYIEFWADKTPTIHKVKIELGEIDLKRIPTVDDPKWTGDFNDDTEEMLFARAIYGEAGGENKEAKIAVAWTIRNRVEDSQNRWGKSYHKVILQPFQYEPFNDKESKIFKKITNPSLDNKGELQAWRDSFEIAGKVIYGKVADNTKDANHFYVPSDQPKQTWVDEKKFTIQIGTTRFYKL